MAAKTSSQKTYFFGEDYDMKMTVDEAQSVPGSLSLEECLNHFDERVV